MPSEPTDTAPLRAELERAAAPEDVRTVFELIERQKPELAKALPDAIGVERFTRTVLTEIRRTPRLLECSPESLLGAMMLAAQLGLEPGPLGHVYFVPFKRAVEFIIGYRGYIDLAYRSGQVKQIGAELVHDGDAFHVEKGSRPSIKHVPLGPAEDREIHATYAIAHLRSGGAPFAVLYEAEWEQARRASASGKDGKGPWAEHRPAMIRKTAIRRLAPILPQTSIQAMALEADEAPAATLAEVVDEGGLL
jgi:recombination protein RecT